MTTLKKVASWLVALAGLAPAFGAAGTITYFHNDIAGSPVVATDQAGQVIWRESYRPYGERTSNNPAAAGNKVWFTSRHQDATTGLVYMGARYYDPVVGRSISTDPVGFDAGNIHSHNRYAYANNNPYKYTDPDGRSPAIIAIEIAKWTGLGYGFGVAADALGQYAAWGQVDLSLAAKSSAAVAGGSAGLLAGMGLGGQTAAAREGAETYKIVDGVRRAKAAEASGKSTISAEVEGTGGKVSQIPIDALRSPKDVIEASGAGAGRWASVLGATQEGKTLPPILVRPGQTGTPIKDVKIQ